MTDFSSYQTKLNKKKISNQTVTRNNREQFFDSLQEPSEPTLNSIQNPHDSVESSSVNQFNEIQVSLKFENKKNQEEKIQAFQTLKRNKKAKTNNQSLANQDLYGLLEESEILFGSNDINQAQTTISEWQNRSSGVDPAFNNENLSLEKSISDQNQADDSMNSLEIHNKLRSIANQTLDSHNRIGHPHVFSDTQSSLLNELNVRNQQLRNEKRNFSFSELNQPMQEQNFQRNRAQQRRSSQQSNQNPREQFERLKIGKAQSLIRDDTGDMPCQFNDSMNSSLTFKKQLNESFNQLPQRYGSNNSKFKERASQFKQELTKIFPANLTFQSCVRQNLYSSQTNISTLLPANQTLSCNKINNTFTHYPLQQQQIIDLPKQIDSLHAQVGLNKQTEPEIRSETTVESNRNVQGQQELLTREQFEEELKESLEKERIKFERHYQAKINESINKLEQKQKDQFNAYEKEIQEQRKRSKAQLQMMIDQVREREEIKAKRQIKKNELKVKSEWDEKEKKLRQELNDQYSMCLVAEKENLKFQLKELENKYLTQISQRESVNQREQQDLQTQLTLKYQREVQLLNQEISELKQQRDTLSDNQCDLIKRHQHQLKEVEDRVKNDCQHQYNILENQYINLKQEKENLLKLTRSMKDEVSEKENIRQQYKQVEIGKCLTCDALMQANQQLIEKLKKQEQMNMTFNGNMPQVLQRQPHIACQRNVNKNKSMERIKFAYRNL